MSIARFMAVGRRVTASLPFLGTTDVLDVTELVIKEIEAAEEIAAATAIADAAPDFQGRRGLDLLRIAGNDPAITKAINEKKKILAIKELRTITGIGLKEAKDAIDELVEVSAQCEHGLSASLCDGPMHYPADNHRDEPPF